MNVSPVTNAVMGLALMVDSLSGRVSRDGQLKAGSSEALFNWPSAKGVNPFGSNRLRSRGDAVGTTTTTP